MRSSGTRTTSWTRRRTWTVVLATVATAALVTVASGGISAARAGGVAAKAATSASRAVTARTAKTPPRITTLGELNRWMGAAVTTKASASFTHTTVAGAKTVTDRKSGVVRWAKGTASFAYTDVNQPYVGVTKAIVVPPEAFSWGASEAKDGAGKPVWVRLHEGAAFANNPFWTLEFQVLRQQLNPALMYSSLPALKVTRGRSSVKVDGTACWVYTVKMTTLQHFRTLPVGARPEPADQAGGITTVSFSVDAQGLPHKVVVLNAWPKSRYSEITTFSGWGKPVVIKAPDGVPVIDSETL